MTSLREFPIFLLYHNMSERHILLEHFITVMLIGTNYMFESRETKVLSV